MQLNDVGVIELLQEGYLSEGPLGVGWVLEGIENLFEGEDVTRFFISGFPDVAVGATSHFF